MRSHYQYDSSARTISAEEDKGKEDIRAHENVTRDNEETLISALTANAKHRPSATRSRITRDEASSDTKKSPFIPRPSPPSLPLCANPPVAPTRRERGRENIAVGVQVSRGRTPCASPRRFSSARHLRSTAADYTGGCPAIVTLALLIACPTKVYHYHRHPSCPPSALNPLVSRCTYCSVFLSLGRCSPFPTATYHSSRLVSTLSLSLSLSFPSCTFSAPLFIITRTHTRVRFRAAVLPGVEVASRFIRVIRDCFD